MKKFACCPKCRYVLCKGEKGTNADIKCGRCKYYIRVVIDDDVSVHIMTQEEREEDCLLAPYINPDL